MRVALSLKQPWAWAVLFCGKDIENRTWRTCRRGRVVVHASRTLDVAGLERLRALGYEVPDDLTTGAFVGEITITDCLSVAECDSSWAWGPWCYTLADPRPYETPIPARGRLGFFPVPDWSDE
jgi:hypothetical protein